MTDYSKLKVSELKDLLISRSLPVTGNKPDLVSRLQEADAAAQKQPEVSKPATSAPKEEAKAPSAEPTKATETSDGVDQELEKRKKRAARFGIEVNEKTKALEREKRFGAIDKKTTKGLGGDAKPTSKTAKKIVQQVDAEEEERRKKRAARFG